MTGDSVAQLSVAVEAVLGTFSLQASLEVDQTC